jgi:hypothetical protein
MKSRNEVPDTLELLFHRHGVPRSITVDEAPELMYGKFKRKCVKARVHHKAIEPYSPWLNKAESGVHELKRLYSKLMQRKNAPRRLWDVCLQFASEIRCHTALDILSLDGDVPEAVATGDTPDISHLCDFEWYDWCWYIDPPLFPEERRNLGRYLGPYHDVGGQLCKMILSAKGKLIVRTSVFPMSIVDTNSEVVKLQKHEFDKGVKREVHCAK